MSNPLLSSLRPSSLLKSLAPALPETARANANVRLNTMKSHSPQLASRGAITVEKRHEVVWKDTPPAHHLNTTQTRFQNPWPSFRFPRTSQAFRFALSTPFNFPKIPPDLAELIPSRAPDWGADKNPKDLKATWLGHACFLVELPAPDGAARGPRILFDPVMSHRCSPSQWIGPQRLLPTPVAAEDIPQVDAVVISHCHYDHMDFPTLSTLLKRHSPHFFVPLGNAPHLAAVGIPNTHIHTLDWWEESAVAVDLPSSPSSDEAKPPKASFVLTCTPAQHLGNRGLFDRWHTLWSSWAVAEDVPVHPDARPRTLFFGGDTGYKTVAPGEEDREAELPHCPAFAEVGEKFGEKFGGFDLALLPIGAYGPRTMFSSMHASPGDAVAIFKDIRAKRALGMHWGTWTLTAEPTMEPPALLKEECAKAGVPEGAFGVCGLGETVVV